MKIGVEVEFFTLRKSGHITLLGTELIQEFGLKREFYHGMYEKTYLFENTIDIGSIRNDLREITKGKQYGIPLKSVLIPIADGVASCGVHLHLDMDVIKDVGLVEKLLVYNKFKYNPSLRFLHSHHIWGSYRPYRREWKRNVRFRPIAYSEEREDKPETWEIRIYDLEDLFNGVINRGLAIIKALYEGKKPSRALIEKADRVMDRLINLDAENMFGYRDIEPETARLLYRILKKRCPEYRSIGQAPAIRPRFYSLTSIDAVAINELIFEIAEKEESVCVA